MNNPYSPRISISAPAQPGSLPVMDLPKGMSDRLLTLHGRGFLEALLRDRTTSRNIIWATDTYRGLGPAFHKTAEINAEDLLRHYPDILALRGESRQERTRKHGEVFTPPSICKRMCAYASWQLRDRDWRKFIAATALEITCGEAPFLVNSTELLTAANMPRKGIGILDRKLALIGKKCSSRKEWLKWAYAAYESTYGYEFQGHNLFLARLRLFNAFETALASAWKREASEEEAVRMLEIISWNLWQMDGLSGTLPYGKLKKPSQASLFAAPDPVETPACLIRDWKKGKTITFLSCGKNMKFDFIIGNPPYQEESVGDQKTFAAPIYNIFMDAAYEVGDKVELIHPARFLSNAGATPLNWNKKILNDPHFKILSYEADSTKIFKNTDIKGGIVISYHDVTQNFKPIEVYTPFIELSTILRKINNISSFKSISTIIHNRGLYRFSDLVYKLYPEEMQIFTDSRIGGSSFSRLPKLFTENKPSDGEEYIYFMGLLKSKRVYRWFNKKYFNLVPNLNEYKVLVPAASGSGTFGEELSSPLIGKPGLAHTETFLSIGNFISKNEAVACLKYIKSKFCRTMLGILKITQHLSSEKWIHVPLQDFTSQSDIDWSVSIPEIDRQLYAKYGLDDEEIAFIESHVREMK